MEGSWHITGKCVQHAGCVKRALFVTLLILQKKKLVWSNGDGEGLRVCETQSAGRVGTLICGENTMMAQQEHIHIATFPRAWPYNVHEPTIGMLSKSEF